MIVTKNLTKLFGEFVAVNRLNLEIQEGEIFALLGPNGAGKTTTIRMLAAILPPSVGTATIDGFDIKEDSMAVRATVGILSENPSLYERLTARDNLTFFARLYDVPKDQITTRIVALGELFDLTGRLDEKVGTFSKGMKQKLAIARALIHDPKILFLDEPTSALSPEAAKVIRDLLIDLAKDRSRTICICTHNLFDAERLCDRVGIINHGKILALGSPAEISQAYSGPPEIRIQLKNLTNHLLEMLTKLTGVISVNRQQKNELKINVEDHQEITPLVVKKLVQEEAEILKVEVSHASLEDAYLRLMEEKNNLAI
jgi:ABC-2 type transport system ATP-binding protein